MSQTPGNPPANDPSQQNTANPYAPSTIQQSATPSPMGPAGRGGLILGLGIASLVLSLLSMPIGLCCSFFAIPIVIIGIVLGGLAAAWGNADLKAMKEGSKDPAEKNPTQTGMIMGIIGAAISILLLIFVVAMLIFAFALPAMQGV